MRHPPPDPTLIPTHGKGTSGASPVRSVLLTIHGAGRRAKRLMHHELVEFGGGQVPSGHRTHLGRRALSSPCMPETGVGRGAPIFLAGVDRSGIGLLGEVLECHPDVSMTRRTDFWAYYDGRFGDLTEARNVERGLNEMMKDPRMRLLEPNRERFRADFAQGEPTYSRLFELLQIYLMEHRGRSRWGDKSLGSERFADTILSAYPSARMIHVIRDPRDRYASQKHHRGPVRGGAGSGAALWQWSERLASSNLHRFSQRYRVIRYEDLVTDPVHCLEGIARFLDLNQAINPWTESIEAKPLTVASVDRYWRDLSATDRRFIEVTNRRGMRRWGYASDLSPLPPLDRLRFWVGVVPTRAISGIRWQTTSKVRDRRGRNPSSRRLTAEPDRDEGI